MKSAPTMMARKRMKTARTAMPRTRARRRKPATESALGLWSFARLGFRRIRNKTRVLAIVIAERRRKGVLVDKSQQLPPRALIVAAIFRRSKHAEHRQHARSLKERRRIHVV